MARTRLRPEPSLEPENNEPFCHFQPSLFFIVAFFTRYSPSGKPGISIFIPAPAARYQLIDERLFIFSRSDCTPVAETKASRESTSSARGNVRSTWLFHRNA